MACPKLKDVLDSVDTYNELTASGRSGCPVCDDDDLSCDDECWTIKGFPVDRRPNTVPAKKRRKLDSGSTPNRYHLLHVKTCSRACAHAGARWLQFFFRPSLSVFHKIVLRIDEKKRNISGIVCHGKSLNTAVGALENLRHLETSSFSLNEIEQHLKVHVSMMGNLNSSIQEGFDNIHTDLITRDNI